MDYVSSISSAIMALVWLVYFQIFFVQYRRNNRPFLVIHHAQNENPDSPCLLINMGKEAVHVQCVQAVIRTRDGESMTLPVTQYERVSSDDENLQHNLRQGPIDSGGFLVLGSFRNIILGNRSEEDQFEHRLEDVSELYIRAALMHGPSKHPVGVRRAFVLKHGSEGSCIYPDNIYTEQMLGRKTRTEVRGWIESELNPENTGGSESEHSSQSSKSND